jgi:hypothetical protein
MSATHAPAAHAEDDNEEVVKPVVKSNKVKIIIGFVLFIFVLFCLQKYQGSTKSATYELKNMQYDIVYSINIPAHQSVEVIITNDFISWWSSESITMYGNVDGEIVLEGTNFVSGTDNIQNKSYRLKNETDHFITVRIGRCKSSATCKIKF